MTKTLPSKKCKHCQSYFTPKKKDQQYCNDTCREAYYDEHHFKKQHATKICPRCGVSFSTTKPIRQIYCSPECRDGVTGSKEHPKPSVCELCEGDNLKLIWHSRNGTGLYLCKQCRTFVGRYNQGMGERYKELIEQGAKRK